MDVLLNQLITDRFAGVCPGDAQELRHIGDAEHNVKLIVSGNMPLLPTTEKRGFERIPLFTANIEGDYVVAYHTEEKLCFSSTLFV